MSVATRKIVNKGGEALLTKILSKNPDVTIKGTRIRINENFTTVGNGTWGHIDYLVRHCGYSREFIDYSKQRQKRRR